jgi:hypothetical protein
MNPVSLYYSYSEDFGFSWVQPQLVTELPIQWSKIFGSNGANIQRFWQVDDSGESKITFDQSSDYGISWSPGGELMPSLIPSHIDTINDPAGPYYPIINVRQST